jgi:hypothetical protein
MALKRATIVQTRLAPDVLTARMVGIGMNFAATPEPDADIEATLVEASIVGMDEHDFRVLAVLTTWFGIHHTYVRADRLVRLVQVQKSERVRAYWPRPRTVAGERPPLRPVVKLFRGSSIELLPVGNAFQIRRRGEDDRFVKSKVHVTAATLRDRADDVLGPTDLACCHAGYRSRVIIGPTPRADAWTAWERGHGASVSEVARRAGSSYATAWQAGMDFRLLRRSGG